MGERGNVLIVMGAYCVLFLWTVLPDRGIIHPFPLNPEQAINSQTYIWVATIYAAFLMFTWVVYRLTKDSQARAFFDAVFIIQALQFGEYFLNYNATWAEIYGLPVTIATLRFPVLFCFVVYTFIKWKT